MNSPIEIIKTPLLEIGYLEQGPADGRPLGRPEALIKAITEG